MVRQQIIFDDKTARMLKRTAKRDKKTMSQIVRESVYVRLSGETAPKSRRGDPAFLLDMCQNAVSLGKGNENLSQEIDTVLYG